VIRQFLKFGLDEVKTVEVERWLRATDVADGTKAKIYYNCLKEMAGTTRLELATSAVTALRELVLQQLTTPRGLPNYLQAAQDISFCGVRFVRAHHAVVLQQ